MLRAARSWRVAPTVFVNQRIGPIYRYDGAGRVVAVVEWTETDTDLAMALENYEAGLCPGCQLPLGETSKPEHQDAYRSEQPIRCHYCTARALVDETAEKQEHSAGLLIPLTLDPEIVELNLKPIPPLPPELEGI